MKMTFAKTLKGIKITTAAQKHPASLSITRGIDVLDVIDAGDHPDALGQVDGAMSDAKVVGHPVINGGPVATPLPDLFAALARRALQMTLTFTGRRKKVSSAATIPCRGSALIAVSSVKNQCRQRKLVLLWTPQWCAAARTVKLFCKAPLYASQRSLWRRRASGVVDRRVKVR